MSVTSKTLEPAASRSRVLSLFSLSAIPAVAAVLSTIGPEPSLRSPYPWLAFVFAVNRAPTWYVVLIAAGSFLIFNADTVLARSGGIPARLQLVASVTYLFNAIHLIRRWSAGVEHQGIGHMIGVTALDVLVMLFFALLVLRWRSQATPLRVQLLAALFHTWLFWCAFPYLGEGI